MDRTKLFQEFICKKPEEINEIFDTGMFNSIIHGYLALVLREQNRTKEEIAAAQAILSDILDNVSAEQARKEG